MTTSKEANISLAIKSRCLCIQIKPFKEPKDYSELIAKITEPEKKVAVFNNDMDITIKGGKNNKYIFIDIFRRRFNYILRKH